MRSVAVWGEVVKGNLQERVRSILHNPRAGGSPGLAGRMYKDERRGRYGN